MARWIIGTIVVIVASVGIVTAREKPENLPKEVRQAEETLTKWMKGFEGQTPEEIRKSLGKPDQETDWLFRGEKQPLYRYQVSATTKLSIYFNEGRAVQARLAPASLTRGGWPSSVVGRWRQHDGCLLIAYIEIDRERPNSTRGSKGSREGEARPSRHPAEARTEPVNGRGGAMRSGPTTGGPAASVRESRGGDPNRFRTPDPQRTSEHRR